MKKEFIPYEQALDLKELGFDEPCFGCYTEKKELIIRVGDYRSFSNNDSEDNIIIDFNSYENGTASAPTFSQAFCFFREKYNLFGYPFPNDYQKYGYRIVEITSDENKELVYDWGTKDTCEEAELECLKKLIEIVKRKIV